MMLTADWYAVYAQQGSGDRSTLTLPVVGWTLDSDDPAGYVISEEEQLCRADSPKAGHASGSRFTGYESAAETLYNWLYARAASPKLPLVRVELVTGRRFVGWLADRPPFPPDGMLALWEAEPDAEQVFVAVRSIASITIVQDDSTPAE
jgi:hypothetical protein